MSNPSLKELVEDIASHPQNAHEAYQRFMQSLNQHPFPKEELHKALYSVFDVPPPYDHLVTILICKRLFEDIPNEVRPRFAEIIETETARLQRNRSDRPVEDVKDVTRPYKAIRYFLKNP